MAGLWRENMSQKWQKGAMQIHHFIDSEFFYMQ